MSDQASEYPSNLLRWEDLRGPAFEALDRANTPVVLSCSPLEVHGPHLPVQTDIAEAEALVLRAASKLAALAPELRAVKLPYLYVAADVVPRRGSLPFRPSTVVRVLDDLLCSLARQGFRHIWIANFHGGPRHFLALDVAADRANRRYGLRAVSLFSVLMQRLTGGRSDLPEIMGHIEGFDPESLRGDEHGGAIETSLMLRIAPALVDKAFRVLPRRTIALRAKEQGRPGSTFDGGFNPGALLWSIINTLDFFGHETYAGAPALASAEAGDEILDILAEHTALALNELWTGHLHPSECRSPLWPLRHVFLFEPLGDLIEKLSGRPSHV